jgi:hypothetical protein
VTDGPERPGGYTIVLPPGWRRIPLREGAESTEQAARNAVGDALRSLPRDVPRDRLAAFRAESEGRLRRMAAEVRKQGGVDLYLPVEAMRGIPISASFVVSEGSLGTGEAVDPAQVVSYLATEDGAGERTPATVDGATALRVEHVAAPEPTGPAAEVPAATRRVDYIIPVPREPHRWLVVAFSTLDDGDSDDRLASLLVQLFDAMMSTFRWTWIRSRPQRPGGASDDRA